MRGEGKGDGTEDPKGDGSKKEKGGDPQVVATPVLRKYNLDYEVEVRQTEVRAFMALDVASAAMSDMTYSLLSRLSPKRYPRASVMLPSGRTCFTAEDMELWNTMKMPHDCQAEWVHLVDRTAKRGQKEEVKFPGECRT